MLEFFALHFYILAEGVPLACMPEISWAYEVGKIQHPLWYDNMADVAGVEAEQATFNDFQRFFKCADMKNDACNSNGLQFPLRCSKRPCNTCSGIDLMFITTIHYNYLTHYGITEFSNNI